MAQGIKEQEPDARVVYADIFHLPHWRSQTRKPMSAYERAAFFSPFAALDDYEEMVDEEAREVGKQQTLSEAELEILNQKLNLIYDMLEDGHLTFTYFICDCFKAVAPMSR